MAPTIVLIRHAQALHNVAQDYSIHDPQLSGLGKSQCAALREKLQAEYAGADSVAIVASPMRRTLQTAMLGLDWLVESGVPIEADADWQENSDKPCDTGSLVASLAPDFPSVDFSRLDAVWPDKTTLAAQHYSYSRQAILARARRCLEALHQRPEKLVFVVSHSGFLRLGLTGWWFFNSDYRVFDIQGSLATLTLSQHEHTRGGGMGLSWTHQVELGSDLPTEEDPAEES